MRDRSGRDERATPVASSSPSQASHSPQSSRRRFLFALGATGAGAVAVAAASPSAAALASVAPANVPVDDRASRGYQETEHVRDYYATARL
jgi:hypothetical protein